MKTFWEYLGCHEKRRPESQAHLAQALIQQSGRQGISRGKLGSLVDLAPKTLNELLDGLVRVGIIVAFRQGEYLLYRGR